MSWLEDCTSRNCGPGERGRYKRLFQTADDQDEQMKSLLRSGDGLAAMASKDDVSRWFASATKQDAMAVLSALAKARPEVVKAAVAAGNDAAAHADWLRKGEQSDVEWGLRWMGQDRPELLCKVAANLITPEEHVNWFADAPDNHVLDALYRLAIDRPELLRRAQNGAEITPEEHMAWLLRGKEADVMEGLDRLACSKPYLVRDAWERRRAAPVEHLAPARPQIPDKMPLAGGMRTTLQFSAPIYYCAEGEHTVNLEVMRVGDLDLHTEVRYTTYDGSARAGRIFTHTQGTLIFEPGDTCVDLQIPLLDNDQWDTTLDFGVQLLTDGLMNADLEEYMYKARIYVLDNDSFPTNRFQNQILEGDIENVPKPQLLMEYFRLCWSNDVIRYRTIRAGIIDQFHNCYFVAGLFVNVYLVDFVLNTNEVPEEELPWSSRQACLLLLVLINVVPSLMIHIVDVMKCKYYGVAGYSRRIIMIALLRRFLNFDSTVRNELTAGKFFMAVSRDAFVLSQQGYGNVLAVLKSIGSLVATVVYLFVVPVAFGKPFTPVPLMVMGVFPVLMLVYLVCRMRVTSSHLSDRNHKQDDIVNFVDQTMSAFRIIADYNRRSHVSDMFEGVVNEFNKANRAMNLVLLNNTYFAQFLVKIAVGLLMIVSGIQVIDGSCSLGMFLTNIRLIMQIGTDWGAIYEAMLEMQGAFHALEIITGLLNKPTDIPVRMKITRHMQHQSHNLQAQLAGSGMPPGLVVDYLPITMEGIKMSNTMINAHGETARTTELTKEGRIEICQGQLVCILGHHGEGKSTILRALGGVLFPQIDHGVFFVPPHLRVLHVTAVPLFLDGTLHDNLTLGVGNHGHDGREERVQAICRRLGLPEDVMRLVASKEQHVWDRVLSAAQCQMLSLACALIANPEVLVMHRPTNAFGDATSRRVLGLLREFVSNRGLEQDPATCHLRRPRTCIFSSEKRLTTENVDVIFHVAGRQGITRLEKMAVSESMLG